MKSTIAAESLAMQKGTEHSFVIARFLKEITAVEDGFPVTIHTDNESLEQNFKASSTLTEKPLNMDINKKGDPILNMTPKQVTHVRIGQRLLLIAQQPQRTTIHRGLACS